MSKAMDHLSFGNVFEDIFTNLKLKRKLNFKKQKLYKKGKT